MLICHRIVPFWPFSSRANQKSAVRAAPIPEKGKALNPKGALFFAVFGGIGSSLKSE